MRKVDAAYGGRFFCALCLRIQKSQEERALHAIDASRVEDSRHSIERVVGVGFDDNSLRKCNLAGGDPRQRAVVVGGRQHLTHGLPGQVEHLHVRTRGAWQRWVGGQASASAR